VPGPLTLGEIVSRLGGRVAGDAGTRVGRVASLEAAQSGDITFFMGQRHRARLQATRAAAVVLTPEAEGDTRLPRIVAEDPYAYFARLSQIFNPVVSQPPGVHASAVVSAQAIIEEGASIGAGCVIGDGVTIGEGSCLYPRVVVYSKCSIGKKAIIHSGAVIGADGFGFADERGRWIKIPQVGGVRIGDDVEIGANTTIDRGTLDDTLIEEGVKIDNQVQVGHNTRIGAHTAVAGCVGIAGSADIGRHCRLGGAAMILGHLKIVDHVTVSPGTFISRSILKPGTYTGIYPTDEHESWARAAAWLRRKGKKHD
jgi:UDP-3-O-[3-hydroxymyristoyl] glucosamine N-acyltransferase